MTEGLFLSQTDSRPMYMQIMEGIKLKIAVGDWPPDFALPSIRELAAASRVSVITVKRAYQELEQEGLIVTRQGRGSFVAANAYQAELRDTELTRAVGQLLEIADNLDVTGDAVILAVKATLDLRKTPKG